MTCICIFVILPLTLVGTILGRNLAGTPDAPCRVNAVPRPIPEKKWFMEPLVIIMLGGILPFGSIFIEMYVRNPFRLSIKRVTAKIVCFGILEFGLEFETK